MQKSALQCYIDQGLLLIYNLKNFRMYSITLSVDALFRGALVWTTLTESKLSSGVQDGI